MRPLTALLTANAVSITGTAMTLLAVPWFVLTTTGSAGKTGVAAACETVPLFVASALGGPLVDRLGPRRTAVGSDLLSAAGVAAIPLLHHTTGIAFWQLCLLIAWVGLVRAPGDTARAVLLPQVLGTTAIERATSLYDGVSRGARMLGAPVAGALIALTSPADVLLVDAASFVTSGLLLRAFVTSGHGSHDATEGYLAQLRGGVRALREDRLLTGVVLMVLVTNMLDAGGAAVLTPVYAREVLHSSVGLGLVYACFGIGALVGTVLYGTYGPGLPRWPVFTATFLFIGGPRFFFLAGHPPVELLLAGQVVFGLACGCINPLMSVVEYERIPEHLRSRVFGVMGAGAIAGMPVGALLAGGAVSRLGLDGAIVAFGAVYLAATLSPLVWARTWRQMDEPRVTMAA